MTAEQADMLILKWIAVGLWLMLLFKDMGVK
jgi:hypothetical protein